jgi:hypothetical protein
VGGRGKRGKKRCWGKKKGGVGGGGCGVNTNAPINNATRQYAKKKRELIKHKKYIEKTKKIKKHPKIQKN